MSDDDTVYIGDGVYAEPIDGYGIWLMANDAKDPTDKIFLEDFVLAQLVMLARKHQILGPVPTKDE